MSAFLSSFLGYLFKMLILAAIAVLGGFIGITMRKKKNSKEETQITETSSEN